MSASPDPPGDRRGVKRRIIARGTVGAARALRLECGHTVPSRGRQGATYRRCLVCAGRRADMAGPFRPEGVGWPPREMTASPVADDGLTEVGRILLRLLPPPGEPFPPGRRAAYLATARALFEYTWGGRDGD